MARMSPADRYYEWLLSDHPEAASERARRRASYQAFEDESREVLAGFAERTEADPTTPEAVRRLAATARWLLGLQAERLAADAALSPAERLARIRAGFELERHASGDLAYRYPARYQGPRAARQPIPPDPDHPTTQEGARP